MDMMKVTPTDRAPKEVAKHFYHKYGFERSLEIISKRLDSVRPKQDTEFWADVLHIIEALRADETGEFNSSGSSLTQKGNDASHSLK